MHTGPDQQSVAQYQSFSRIKKAPLIKEAFFKMNGLPHGISHVQQSGSLCAVLDQYIQHLDE